MAKKKKSTPRKKSNKKVSKKTSKKTSKSAAYKKFQQKKKEAELNRQFNIDKQDTIHNAKSILLDFFKKKDKKRKDKKEVVNWQEKKKALYKFNRIIREERIKLEDKIKSGKEVKKSNDALFLKSRIQIEIPKSVRNTLDTTYPRVFKQKGFLLKEIPYFTANNKIKYFSGKDFYFVLDTGFQKHYIPNKELKKLTVLSDFDLTKHLLNIYEKDFNKYIQQDAKIQRTQKEKKNRQRVYDKIRKALEHNKAILEGKTKVITKKDKKGNEDRSEGEYPILFEMFDELIEMMIA